ncbi:MAG: GIY-YIG nuclease family protein [Calditrichaeota bacterium]|nr:GIY-YIG nuclease family protein [Calditrichota bacterium]
MFYTYILQNTRGQFYIGQTSNLEDRLKRHNSGRSKFTTRIWNRLTFPMRITDLS